MKCHQSKLLNWIIAENAAVKADKNLVGADLLVLPLTCCAPFIIDDHCSIFVFDPYPEIALIPIRILLYFETNLRYIIVI